MCNFRLFSTPITCIPFTCYLGIRHCKYKPCEKKMTYMRNVEIISFFFNSTLPLKFSSSPPLLFFFFFSSKSRDRGEISVKRETVAWEQAPPSGSRYCCIIPLPHIMTYMFRECGETPNRHGRKNK